MKVCKSLCKFSRFSWIIPLRIFRKCHVFMEREA
jgi:hypothetical protein